MNLVSLTTLKSSALESKTISPLSKKNATKSFYGSGKLAFTISGVNRYAGRHGNRLRVLVTRQSGVRYFIALWDVVTGTKLDGTVNTASEGAPTTAAAIVNKIKATNLREYITATLSTDCTNVDFTGTAGVSYSDSRPLRGGRN